MSADRHTDTHTAGVPKREHSSIKPYYVCSRMYQVDRKVSLPLDCSSIAIAMIQSGIVYMLIKCPVPPLADLVGMPRLHLNCPFISIKKTRKQNNATRVTISGLALYSAATMTTGIIDI